MCPAPFGGVLGDDAAAIGIDVQRVGSGTNIDLQARAIISKALQLGEFKSMEEGQLGTHLIRKGHLYTALALAYPRTAFQIAGIRRLQQL